MKKHSLVFFNGTIVLSAIFATLFVLDLLNPNMNFLNGTVSKLFLILFCIFSAGAGVCGISDGSSADDRRNDNT